MTALQQPRHPVPDHIPAELREAFATVKGREVPPHSPFQSGAPVQLHGFAGNPDEGLRRTGFRGWVAASIGATILTGITTTGQEWAQYWGDLDPDGQPLDPWRWCTCCRDAREAYFAAQHAREAAAGLQLNLFGTEVAS